MLNFFIKNFKKLTGPLYSKLGLTGVKNFNKEDIMQVEKIKEVIKNCKTLSYP